MNTIKKHSFKVELENSTLKANSIKELYDNLIDKKMLLMDKTDPYEKALFAKNNVDRKVFLDENGNLDLEKFNNWYNDLPSEKDLDDRELASIIEKEAGNILKWNNEKYIPINDAYKRTVEISYTKVKSDYEFQNSNKSNQEMIEVDYLDSNEIIIDNYCDYLNDTNSDFNFVLKDNEIEVYQKDEANELFKAYIPTINNSGEKYEEKIPFNDNEQYVDDDGINYKKIECYKDFKIKEDRTIEKEKPSIIDMLKENKEKISQQESKKHNANNLER